MEYSQNDLLITRLISIYIYTKSRFTRMSEVKSGDEFELGHRIKFHGMSRGLPRVSHTEGGGGLKENYARNMYNTPLHIDRRARKPAFLANTEPVAAPESSLLS